MKALQIGQYLGATRLTLLRLLPIWLLALSACASSSIQPLGTNRYPEKPKSCEVKVFPAFSTVPQKYEELAVVKYTSAYGGFLFAKLSTKKITNVLGQQACQTGADAIIIRQIKEGSRWTWARGRGEAVAIKFSPAKRAISSVPLIPPKKITPGANQ